MLNKLKSILAKWREPSSEKLEKKLLKYAQSGKHPQVMSIDDTIETIVQNNLSIARFGDGEYSLCLGKGIPFQKYDEKLGQRLSTILKNAHENTNCLVGIFDYNLNNMSKFWRYYYYHNFNKITPLLVNSHLYANQNVSREITEKGFENLKRIWNKRKVIFVIGKGSRFEYVDELYGNAMSHKFIYGAPVNAWSNYNELLNECLKEPKEDGALFLIALGPTATVLAYDLSLSGYQAVDLGHLSNIYLKHIGKANSPESLPVKK